MKPFERKPKTSKQHNSRAEIGKGAVLAALVSTLCLAGCGSGRTVFYPRVVARGELTLRYDNEFQLWAGGQQVANGHHYTNLPPFVRCVPMASEHALAARSDGYTGTTLSTLGIVFGVAGVGGLGGLAYYDSNPNLMFGLLGAGIASSVLGVVLAGVSRGYKNSANGHAVDAMNHYNDAVGSMGANCDDLVYPAPTGDAPPPVTMESPPPSDDASAPARAPTPDADVSTTGKPPEAIR